ncbi:hypothetical protein GCM10009741_36630 [Kribbella lupini]|uniref:Uncharacterized protein n=2 Tax=Kribbella lupini TaxID=291602 RepID=A0ABN2B1U5_9ACTN
MTDAGESVSRWVPPVGMLDVAPERAAVIRGLFELAAFVADHPQLGLPFVEAAWLVCEESFSADMRIVEAAGEALGVMPALAPGAGYSVRTRFASPRVSVRFTAHPTPTGGVGR